MSIETSHQRNIYTKFLANHLGQTTKTTKMAQKQENQHQKKESTYISGSFTTDVASQLDILWLDGNTLGV